MGIDGLPLFATQEVLQSLYPKQTKIVVGKQDTRGKLQAVVHFASAAEATEALKASEGVNVNGETVDRALPRKRQREKQNKMISFKAKNTHTAFFDVRKWEKNVESFTYFQKAD